MTPALGALPRYAAGTVAALLWLAMAAALVVMVGVVCLSLAAGVLGLLRNVRHRRDFPA